MGFFTGLLTLPLAPVRGVAWIAQVLAEQAESELYDENRIRGQLVEMEFALERGDINEAEYEAAEEILLERLREAAARRPQ